MGDFILTLPAIAALRRCWPKAYLELVGHEQSADLALAAGLIDRWQSLDSARLAGYFQNGCPLPPDEKKYLASFDLIVSYLHDPAGVFLGHLQKTGVPKIIAASPLVKSGHAADHFLKAIKDTVGGKLEQDEKFSIIPKTWSHFIKCDHRFKTPCEQFLLKWPQVLKEKARRWLSDKIGEKQIIIIHPGSGSLAKNWSVANFAELAEKIRAETGFEPLVIGGEADTNAITSLRSLLPGFHIIDNLALRDVASIFSAAGGFVGNDSGLTHLAAALGIPVVALFGPTDPAVWAPRGDNVLIVKSRRPTADSLIAIGIESVFQTLLAAVDNNTRPL